MFACWISLVVLVHVHFFASLPGFITLHVVSVKSGPLGSKVPHPECHNNDRHTHSTQSITAKRSFLPLNDRFAVMDCVLCVYVCVHRFSVGHSWPWVSVIPYVWSIVFSLLVTAGAGEISGWCLCV